MYNTKPVNTFVISDPKALGTMDVFINADFKTKDSSSQKWISLQLFQQLISFHRNDADKEALLDINLARLEWVHQQVNFVPIKKLLTCSTRRNHFKISISKRSRTGMVPAGKNRV
jgi:hypothetical protein